MYYWIVENQLAGSADTALPSGQWPSGFTLVEGPDAPINSLYWDAVSEQVTAIPPQPETAGQWAWIGKEWIDVTPQPVASQTNWDGFALWAMADADLAAVFATAQASAPLAASALTTTLLQVQQGNLANFTAAFNAVCAAGGATTAQRNAWADKAQNDFYLPADFVAIVRGNA